MVTGGWENVRWELVGLHSVTVRDVGSTFGVLVFFFFNDTATTEIYTLSLHDALPICVCVCVCVLYLVTIHKSNTPCCQAVGIGSIRAW